MFCFCSIATICLPTVRGEGYCCTKFYTGEAPIQGLFPYSFAHHFVRKGISFLDLLLQKDPPGTYLVYHWIPFLNPWNEVNKKYYWTTSSINTGRAGKTRILLIDWFIYFMFTFGLTSQISLPFDIPQPVKSHPFYLPAVWKQGYPFGRSLPVWAINYKRLPPDPIPVFSISTVVLSVWLVFLFCCKTRPLTSLEVFKSAFYQW